jgi:hypothetical protein
MVARWNPSAILRQPTTTRHISAFGARILIMQLKKFVGFLLFAFGVAYLFFTEILPSVLR